MSKTKCAIKACNEEAATRGLCKSCYQNARRRVEAGEFTWEELERKRIVRPTTRGRRSAMLDAALAAAK